MGNQSVIKAGNVKLRQNISVSYLPQNFDQIYGTIAEFAAEKNIEVQDLLAMLRKLGFERDLFDKRIEQMSMGQKRKIALARSLCEHANIYIWDEPLNYLDVITREQVQDVILKVKPTLLMIDHDREFVEKVGTKIINFEK